MSKKTNKKNMAQLDTRQLVKDLIEGGLSDKLSDILGKAFFSSYNIENLVTKEQFVHLEKDQGDIKTDLAVIKQTMATKTDIAELKVSMAEIKTDILKWMIPFFLGIVALNVTTIGIVISYLVK
jgi:hypothetical protein